MKLISRIPQKLISFQTNRQNSDCTVAIAPVHQPRPNPNISSRIGSIPRNGSAPNAIIRWEWGCCATNRCYHPSLRKKRLSDCVWKTSIHKRESWSGLGCVLSVGVQKLSLFCKQFFLSGALTALHLPDNCVWITCIQIGLDKQLRATTSNAQSSRSAQILQVRFNFAKCVASVLEIGFE